MADTKAILKEVRKIEIKTSHLAEGLLQGAYHSVFKGRGIEFSDIREYVPGDDIRAIDWKVTARMNSPFIKEFIEERDLSVYIVLDVSASNEFGNTKSKKQASIELAASLMFSALRNNDKIGLLMFTDTVENFIPPRKGRRHILKLIREAVEFQPENNATDLNPALRFMSKIAKKKSIILVISDFIADGYDKNLKLLRRKHDVIAVNMNDERESVIPDIGLIELEDEETGEQVLVDTSDHDFRRQYSKLMQARNNALKSTLSKLKIDMIELRSGEPFEIPLKRFFSIRKRRLAR